MGINLMIVRANILEGFNRMPPKSIEDIKKVYPEYNGEADKTYEELRQQLLKVTNVYDENTNYPTKFIEINIANEFQYNRVFVLKLKDDKCVFCGPLYFNKRSNMAKYSEFSVETLDDIIKIVDDHIEQYPLEFLPQWQKP